jgi:hypothetical protein
LLPQLDHDTLTSGQSTHRAIHNDLQLRPIAVKRQGSIGAAPRDQV